MPGDGVDTAFNGGFYRLGLSKVVAGVTVVAEYERGYSSTFEDPHDWGEYKAQTLAAEYPLSDRLIGTASIAKNRYIANTEDSGSEAIVTFGLTVPFGGTYSCNNLTTSYRPGLASAWAEDLD